MNTIYLDFETYYSKGDKYDLNNISLVEYIRDPRFKVFGCGIKYNNYSAMWVPSGKLASEFEKVDWANSQVVAHNAKFDGAILRWVYGVNPARWIDTKSLSKAVLGATVPDHSLRALAHHYKLPAKGELKTDGVFSLTEEQEVELANYCIRDVEICASLYGKLSEDFPKGELLIMDWTVRMFLEPKLCIDIATCGEVKNHILDSKAELVKKTGVDASVLSSNPQFANCLTRLGVSVPTKKNARGKLIPAFSVQDKEFLSLLNSDNPIVRHLVKARIAVKQTLEQTRAEKLGSIAEVSDYCFDVVYSGAKQTHRFSGGNGCAGNPQNFGRRSELRRALYAPTGKKLVVADFRNIELRILAFLSGDAGLVEAITDKRDIYCEFASRIFNRSITKEDSKERKIGKEAVLGLGYGMGAERFVNTVYSSSEISIPLTFAKTTVKLYRETYSGVVAFWESCEHGLQTLVRGHGVFPRMGFLGVGPNTIILPSGLKIRYTKLSSKTVKKFGRFALEYSYERYKTRKSDPDRVKIYGGMVTENICQALAGEVCKEAIRRLIGYGYPPIGQVHDELLVMCDDEELDKVKYLVEVAMTQTMPWWPELPLEAEIGHGRNWLEAK